MPLPMPKDTLMVHCLATPLGWDVGKTPQQVYDAVYRWHVVENGWSGVAYAEIIMSDGTRVKGRDLNNDGDVWSETGAGARGWNKRGVHIALCGGKGSTANDQFSDHYTPEQDASLRAAIAEVQGLAQKRTGGEGSVLRLMGHNEVAAKACPGFRVRPWYAQVPARTLTGSSTMRGAAAGAAGLASAAAGVWGQYGHLATVGLAVAAIGVLAVMWARKRDWDNGRR